MILAAGVALTSCGGGGGGGNGGGGSPILQIVGVPSIGVISGATTTTTAFVVNTPSAATQVAVNAFPAGMAADRNFIQFQFTTNILASTISDGTFSGNEGIVIQDANGNNVRYGVDSAGAIDPTNAFPAPGIAPSLLRVYINEPTLFPGDVNHLAAGTYTVNIVTQNLRGANGEVFCLAGTSSSNCANNVEVSYAFTMGADATNIGPALAGASVPLTGAIFARNGEVRLFFNDNVDFQSIVSRAAGMAPNLTQRDQFVSVPFPVNNANMGATSLGENIAVQYTPPMGTALPVNYGFIVYMPDPFHNPREVRIRFIDGTLAQPNDTFPNVQNYGLPATVYTSAGLTAPVNSSGATFNLPPILPLPGTTPAGAAALSVTLLAAASASGIAPTDSSNTQDGTLGVTDRARNILANDIVVNYALQVGPTIANNPSPPDLHVLVSGNQLTAISGATTTALSIPVAFGDVLIGIPNVIANPLNDTNTLSQPLDIEFGRFLNLTSGTNLVHNPPRRTQIPLPITDNNGDEGIPVPAGGTPQNNLINLVMPPFAPPAPPIGMRMYVIDGGTDQVKIFDSNTFTLLGTLTGVGSPRGLGIAPNLAFLYIANGEQSTITRIGSNPLQTTTFHMLVNTVQVGSNPGAIAVTPNNEDVIVINRGSNSISLVDVASQTQRIELSVGNGPREVVTTNRMLCMGCTLAYESYITNFFSNTVSVYESDSPSIMVNNGPDGKILTSVSGFFGPLGEVWNRWSINGLFPAFQGTYVANSTGTNVQQLALSNFGLAPTPGFPGVPEFRTFTIPQTFATNSIPGSPTDCTIENLSALSTNLFTDTKTDASADINGAGIPSILLVTYPAAGQVAAYDIATTALFGSVAAPGTAIYSYYDQ